MKDDSRVFMVHNEWDKLKEAMVGLEDGTMAPDYMPEMSWMDPEQIDIMQQQAGKMTTDIRPDMAQALREQIEAHVKLLEAHDVKVHRTVPLRYPEEREFLAEVQRGNMAFGGQDFFVVIGNNVILLTNFRYPFRRKQIYGVRPALEPLLQNSSARYAAMPPASPHYSSNELYLEGGDMLVAGRDIYVGCSGRASSLAGIAWLQQYLAPDYRVHMIEMTPDVFHMDGLCMFPREGLVVYSPAHIPALPDSLKKWDKIELQPHEYFGGNGLCLDDKTMVMPKGYERVSKEMEKKGIEVILAEYGMTMEFGSGPRCLTGVIRRDP
ncbi:MAG: hypothetical protein KJ921_10285 [Proteobacteria bacterium]|nr:hypothetical protein [Pseudomonadota bacterium]